MRIERNQTATLYTIPIAQLIRSCDPRTGLLEMVYWIGPIYNGEGRPVYRKGTWVAWLPIGASTPVFKASGHTVQVLNLLIDEGLLPKYEAGQIAEIKELVKRCRLKLQNDVTPGKKTFKSRYLSATKLR